ncbi:GNAT family N-acetyltransferase [Mycolicibacterium tokaiense]|uniref:Acetyltransferase, ribosomal protein N-acetylase n=1 Tax=Mycolicibacterium tokaiense TaxID=39695 RepID=A0A379PJT1_9MYCO|nr:GNAT family protein [Mycolicibacterium tokaiense]SUE94994.1 acetyltransferase, ribosomal protein N-acetylase [Mycolicibacterium tokaiense]
MRDSGIRLVGHRLILREFVDTDENAVHAFASHPLATQFMTWGPNSVEDTRAFLREAAAQADTPTRTSFDLAVVDNESRALIGSAALSITSTEHRRGEIGYVLHPDVWSKGLATEAARTLLQFGFTTLGLRRIAATCHPDNRASSRVLEKAGLVLEGRMRSHLWVRGAWRDSLIYAAISDTAPAPGAEESPVGNRD